MSPFLSKVSLESLRLLWQHSSDTMFVIEARAGRYYLVNHNPAQEQALPAGLDISLALDELLPSDLYDDIQRRYQACIESGQPMSYEEPGIGDDYWLTLLVPLVEHGGRAQYIAGVSRSIKDLKHAERRMREEIARAEHINAQYEALNAELERKVSERTQELALKNAELERLYITDRLTGLCNRYKLDGLLAEEVQRTERYAHPFGVIMIDIDDFKQVNDQHGHQVGDAALVTIANILQDHTRVTDVVGRWGGEEFLILCVETDMSGLLELAEKLRKAIECHDFPVVKQKTASFGVASHEVGDTANVLIQKVDTALYCAKHNGRNRVEPYQNHLTSNLL